LNSRGITSATDGALGPGGTGFQGGLFDAECISVYNDLHNEGELSVRMNVLYLFGTYGAISLEDFKKSIPMVGVHSGFGDEWLKIGGIKLFADGVPQTKTAWLHGEYPDGGNGSLVLPGATEQERYEELVGMIVYAHKNGFQCGIHAIGGRAIESCIDGFLKAQQEDPRELRHYVIHCDLITEADIRRIAENNIGVCTQPILKWVFSDAMDRAFGVERSERQFPLRTLLNAGVHVSLSSDAPVTAPDWLQGVESAVLRKSKASGTVRGPQQAITAREAVRLFTMGGAWQDHMEHRKGSLEPGKLADFCVLEQDILSIPPEEIHAITNVATVVGGQLVYDAGLGR
jgi:predicted amidohydrolase YtcJ